MTSHLRLCVCLSAVLLLLSIHLLPVQCTVDEVLNEEEVREVTCTTQETSVGKATEKEREGKEDDPLPSPNEENVNFCTGSMDNKFEGDIVLTPQQKRVLGLEGGASSAPQHRVHERAVVRDPAELWPNAVVPYVISSDLPASHRSAIYEAIEIYTERTCIRFVPRRRERSFLRFIRGRGCYSFVGRTGGMQDISIGDGCQYKGIVMHEIFHALGRWHEHSRPDRDNYVIVRFENIRPGLEIQFTKLGYDSTVTNGVPYDYTSIMHYSAYTFSRYRGLPTIVPRRSGVSLSSLGQRSAFSSRDMQHIEALYCRNAPSSQWSSWSSWSQCSASCGQGTQSRSRSCRGGSGSSNTCSGPSTQTRNCNSDGPQCPGAWSSWGSWSGCSPTCGNDRSRSRSRTCLGQGRCEGDSTQTQSCASVMCGGGGGSLGTQGLTGWSEWSRCRGFCRGIQYRRRWCVDPSLGCPLPYIQYRLCSTGRCFFDEYQEITNQHADDTGSGEGVPEPSNSAGCRSSLMSLLTASTILVTSFVLL